MVPHFFETFDPERESVVGEWCKHCNCAKTGDGQEHFDRATFADYVAAHGSGEATPQAYKMAERLLATGDDYATAAFEVVASGLTAETEG